MDRVEGSSGMGQQSKKDRMIQNLKEVPFTRRESLVYQAIRTNNATALSELLALFGEIFRNDQETPNGIFLHGEKGQACLHYLLGECIKKSSTACFTALLTWANDPQHPFTYDAPLIHRRARIMALKNGAMECFLLWESRNRDTLTDPVRANLLTRALSPHLVNNILHHMAPDTDLYPILIHHCTEPRTQPAVIEALAPHVDVNRIARNVSYPNGMTPVSVAAACLNHAAITVLLKFRAHPHPAALGPDPPLLLATRQSFRSTATQLPPPAGVLTRVNNVQAWRQQINRDAGQLYATVCTLLSAIPYIDDETLHAALLEFISMLRNLVLRSVRQHAAEHLQAALLERNCAGMLFDDRNISFRPMTHDDPEKVDRLEWRGDLGIAELRDTLERCGLGLAQGFVDTWKMLLNPDIPTLAERWVRKRGQTVPEGFNAVDCLWAVILAGGVDELGERSSLSATSYDGFELGSPLEYSAWS
ncbi:hypothetical protein OQA88_9555 [Cercophora sp. LCS_1]